MVMPLELLQNLLCSKHEKYRRFAGLLLDTEILKESKDFVVPAVDIIPEWSPRDFGNFDDSFQPSLMNQFRCDTFQNHILCRVSIKGFIQKRIRHSL